MTINILVAEEDSDMRRELVNFVKKFKHEVDETQFSDEAMAMLGQKQYDLIILAQKMGSLSREIYRKYSRTSDGDSDIFYGGYGTELLELIFEGFPNDDPFNRYETYMGGIETYWGKEWGSEKKPRLEQVQNNNRDSLYVLTSTCTDDYYSTHFDPFWLRKQQLKHPNIFSLKRELVYSYIPFPSTKLQKLHKQLEKIVLTAEIFAKLKEESKEKAYDFLRTEQKK